ncbi:MAG: DUF3343 domain-containing protein [Planctomycetes bacterium]|nr:DUF3343 domain-containing protein [Planctomycetota bacterium]
MSSEAHAVVVVHSTSHAMKITRRLKERGLAWKLVPVPRHISSDCGVCVRILRADVEAVRSAVAELGVEIVGIEEI